MILLLLIFIFIIIIILILMVILIITSSALPPLLPWILSCHLKYLPISVFISLFKQPASSCDFVVHALISAAIAVHNRALTGGLSREPDHSIPTVSTVSLWGLTSLRASSGVLSAPKKPFPINESTMGIAVYYIYIYIWTAHHGRTKISATFSTNLGGMSLSIEIAYPIH